MEYTCVNVSPLRRFLFKMFAESYIYHNEDTFIIPQRWQIFFRSNRDFEIFWVKERDFFGESGIWLQTKEFLYFIIYIICILIYAPFKYLLINLCLVPNTVKGTAMFKSCRTKYLQVRQENFMTATAISNCQRCQSFPPKVRRSTFKCYEFDGLVGYFLFRFSIVL